MSSPPRLRILVVSALFPPDIGGPATYVPVIARELSSRGHEVTVLTVTDRPPKEDYPFPIVRLPRGLFKPWRWLRTVGAIASLGRRAHVIYVNGLAFEAAVARHFIRRPFVQKVVGDLAWERASVLGWIRENFEEFQSRRYGRKIELLRALRGWWIRRADRVVVPSRYLARWIEKWGLPADRITVVYNSVEQAPPMEPGTVNPLRTARKVVTVARLIPLKQIDRILEAIRPYPDLGLLIVGDGPEEERLRARAKDLDLDSRVHFAGRRTQSETLGLMASSDAFALYSNHETFPHVVLEAMSLGLPVVASAVGGVRELVVDGENGRLVSPTDPPALGRALLEVMEGPARERLTAGARRTALRFGVPSMVGATERVLAEEFSRWRAGLRG